MAELSPLPVKPTQADRDRRLEQLHECVEAFKRDTRQSFAAMGGALALIDDQVSKNTDAVGRMASVQAKEKEAQARWKRMAKAQMNKTESQIMAVAQSVGADKDRPSLAGMSQRKATVAVLVIAALAAVPGTLALIKALSPFILSVLRAAGAAP